LREAGAGHAQGLEPSRVPAAAQKATSTAAKVSTTGAFAIEAESMGR
jgi:hypothetical protein